MAIEVPQTGLASDLTWIHNEAKMKNASFMDPICQIFLSKMCQSNGPKPCANGLRATTGRYRVS